MYVSQYDGMMDDFRFFLMLLQIAKVVTEFLSL